METAHIIAAIAVAGFFVNLVVMIVGGTWKLGRMQAALTEAVLTHKREVGEEFSIVRREFGEAVSALRQKVTDVEIWSRDNFARRDSVHTLGGRLETQMMQLEERLSGQLEKLDKRLEKISSA